MECSKGEWNDAAHNDKLVIVLLLKLTLDGFWDSHSNSDSFHVQKKPIKASVNREIKLSTILAA